MDEFEADMQKEMEQRVYQAEKVPRYMDEDPVGSVEFGPPDPDP